MLLPAIQASLEQQQPGLPEDRGNNPHLKQVVNLISESIKDETDSKAPVDSPEQNSLSSTQVSHRNVLRAVAAILASSDQIRERVQTGTLGVVGAVYHDDTGVVELLKEELPQG